MSDVTEAGRLTDEQRESLLAWVSFDTDEGEAGFLEEVESLIAAGQVAALEDAAEAVSAGKSSGYLHWRERAEQADWLRARAAELSKEQHDQPDAQFPN